jgi:hypothetical protein
MRTCEFLLAATGVAVIEEGTRKLSGLDRYSPYKDSKTNVQQTFAPLGSLEQPLLNAEQAANVSGIVVAMTRRAVRSKVESSSFILKVISERCGAKKRPLQEGASKRDNR